MYHSGHTAIDGAMRNPVGLILAIFFEALVLLRVKGMHAYVEEAMTRGRHPRRYEIGDIDGLIE